MPPTLGRAISTHPDQGPTASTRASSPWQRRAAIATKRTFVMSPNSHACYAAASRPIRIIFASCSHARLGARPATNSPSRFVEFITARFIGPPKSDLVERGGHRPEQSRTQALETDPPE